MNEAKVFISLKKLEKSELRRFRKFVRSTYFNKHKEVIRLFDYWDQSSERHFQAEKVFAHLFPGQEFDAKTLHHIKNYLLEVLEKFLALEDWQQEQNRSDIHLIRAYRKKNLLPAFEKNLKAAQKNLEKNSLRNAQHLKQKYELELEQYDFSLSQGRNAIFNLQQLSDTFDIYFIANKLKTACLLKAHQTVVKNEYKTGLLDSVLHFIKNHSWLKHPAIGIYYYAYLALSEPDESAHFFQLKKLIFENTALFPSKELRDIFLLGINFCIKKLNIGEDAFLNELLELYETGLNSEIFLENGLLSPNTYYNINLVGLKAKRFDWVQQFLDQYKEHLPNSIKENTYNYNKSIYYFRKPDYPKAMELLRSADFDDPLHNITSRTMLLQIYYELQEEDALHSLLDSFKNYLYRQKKLGYHKERYLNFIKYTKKLLKLNFYNKKEVNIFKKEVETLGSISEKQWLLKQVEIFKRKD